MSESLRADSGGETNVNDADRIAVVVFLVAFDVDVFFRLAVQNFATH